VWKGIVRLSGKVHQNGNDGNRLLGVEYDVGDAPRMLRHQREAYSRLGTLQKYTLNPCASCACLLEWLSIRHWRVPYCVWKSKRVQFVQVVRINCMVALAHTLKLQFPFVGLCDKTNGTIELLWVCSDEVGL